MDYCKVRQIDPSRAAPLKTKHSDRKKLQIPRTLSSVLYGIIYFSSVAESLAFGQQKHVIEEEGIQFSLFLVV